MIIPVRLFQVFGAPAADSAPEDRRLLFSFRKEADADGFVRVIAEGVRVGRLSPDDMALSYFYLPLDGDVDLPVSSVDEAIDAGYAVISYIIAAADVPEDGVIGTVIGGGT